MKNLLHLFVLSLLVGCNSVEKSHGDLQVLIDNKIKSSELILKDINNFVREHGRAGFERQDDLAKELSGAHNKVLAFLDSLDRIDPSQRHLAANAFVDKNLADFKVTYPPVMSIGKDTPVELIKLQVVDVEYACLLEWRQNVNHFFDQMMVAIMVDTLTYQSTGKITGRVGFVGYSETVPLKIKVNEDYVEVKQGFGYFSLDPRDLPGSSKTISAEVIFPGTTYSSSLVIR